MSCEASAIVPIVPFPIDPKGYVGYVHLCSTDFYRSFFIPFCCSNPYKNIEKYQTDSNSCFCLSSSFCVACLFWRFWSNARSPTFTSVTAAGVWAGLKSFCAARKKNTSTCCRVLHVLQLSTAIVAVGIKKGKLSSAVNVRSVRYLSIYDAETGHDTTAHMLSSNGSCCSMEWPSKAAGTGFTMF